MFALERLFVALAIAALGVALEQHQPHAVEQHDRAGLRIDRRALQGPQRHGRADRREAATLLRQRNVQAEHVDVRLFGFEIALQAIDALDDAISTSPSLPMNSAAAPSGIVTPSPRRQSSAPLADQQAIGGP